MNISLQIDSVKKKKFKSNLIQLTPDDLHKTALEIQTKSLHGKASEYLMVNILQGNEFDEWNRYLKFVLRLNMNLLNVCLSRAGFNILLHGVGSKKSLVELFFKKHLKNQVFTLIIHGYLPNMSIKQVD